MTSSTRPRSSAFSLRGAARTRVAVLAFTGVSLVGILAGCSSATTAASSGSTTAATHKSSSSHASKASDDNGSPSSGTDDISFKDGSYSAQGTYSSPGGQELISVDLTLAGDVVKSVTVKTVKADPTATSYEAKFIGGISAAVVGKKISDLQVSKVAGSSLTSMGFNDALAKIKTDAKA